MTIKTKTIERTKKQKEVDLENEWANIMKGIDMMPIEQNNDTVESLMNPESKDYKNIG
tara:strand:+ start:5071 stop:5244 length:174 start_codon:yes stop_codon:yes gene_type:complete